MNSIKHICILLLLSITSIAYASLDTCYTVFEVGFEEVGLSYGTSLKLSQDTLQINEDLMILESITEYTFGHRRQVIAFFDCAYDFLFLNEVDLIQIYHFKTELGLDYWFLSSSQQTHLLLDSQFIPLSPCVPDGYCFNKKHCKARLYASYFNISPIKEELQITPAIFETVTEQVLLQVSYNTLQIVPAQFETVTEQYLIQETNICPDQMPIYETVLEQVLVKDAYTTLTAIPAKLTTVTEEVLEHEAYNQFEVIEVNATDSIYIVTTPSYIDYAWTLNEGVCIEDIYNCSDLETIVHQEMVTAIANPITWSCNNIEEWNNQLLIAKEIPATYGKRCYKRLTSPTTTTSTEILATYTTLTKELLANGNQIPDSCIVRQYETRTYQRLVNPATTISQDIPAIYETRAYERLISTATIDSGMLVQNCSQTFDYDYLSIESMVLEEEINCNYIYDEELQQEILTALFDKGFLDSPTIEFGSKPFWEAVLEVFRLKSKTECISNLDTVFFDYLFDQ